MAAMAEPRWIVGLLIGALFAGAAAPASVAPPATAEEALAREQAGLQRSLGLDCGRLGPDPNRLPLPIAPEPGARHAGEPPDAKEALALGDGKCSTTGPNQQCSGGLPLIPIAIWLIQTAIKVAEGDD
jgi:hypothetical protein